jgi:hypothetical protein
MFRKIFILLFIMLAADIAFTQNQLQRYRSDAYGDVQYRRKGIMDGNQIRTLFYNNGEVGQWPFQPSGEWPKGTGHSYLDGVALLIATELVAPGNNQVIHPLQTSYREWMDRDPVTGLIWGLEPLPGYMNHSSGKAAFNTDPNSWPSFWPNALDLTPDWNGYWYGYFGRGVQNSDFETFYVMDDSKDKEWIRQPYNFVPLASDPERAGLGLRVEVRGFQWSHVLAEDIIFWHYDIVNISDFEYPTTLFGFYTDCGVGGTDDSGDDMASFDTRLDLTYCFDYDGLGLPDGWATGYYGYAYLESPGNSFNFLDDDEDGMIDERRDDGEDNDNDWVKYSDLNLNGKWDPEENEPLNNDVGKDGVGPFDRQYNGPDEGEGDGFPTPGEPNFDQTDKDESDQIGLTAVAIYRLGDGGAGGGWPKDDEQMWQKMNYANFDTALSRANISMVFSSGPFPLKSALRERFSMALVFGSNFEDIVFNKETVQQIYNANYNFSKPPSKPSLTAVAGDKQVFLYWDKLAEESRDPFLGFEDNDPTKGYKKDFEGYLIYRSTEAEFNDVKIITDSKGEPKYWKPIAQFDLKDGIKGPDPVGINGAHFWRGEDSGLRYSYIDKDVNNGQKYYYAVVSYDMGDPAFGTAGLQPAECTKIITEDFSGTLNFVDINCAVVTPNAPVAGYISPDIIGNNNTVTSGLGTGRINVTILNPEMILDGAVYKVLFESKADSLNFPKYRTTSYDVIKEFQGVIDTVARNIDSSAIGAGRMSPPFDGLTVSILNDTSITVIDTMTGWWVGASKLAMIVSPEISSRGIQWPANYVINFYDTPQDTCFINSAPYYSKFPVNFKVWNITEDRYSKIAIRDNDTSRSLTPGDVIQILEFISPSQTLGTSRVAWNISYDFPFDPNASLDPPKNGDKFVITTRKPLKTGDYFTFSTKPVNVDNSLAKNDLSKIGVVPNPYLGAASWERRNLNSTGRGERKIDFINLPAFCTIRIYTSTGALIKTLVKESSFSDGSLSWNLVTEDGMDAAYGLYIFHVEAPGIGEHVGKFALIK